MWVSTAITGSPNTVLSTTLAVLRPTPGRASSAARSCGTSPPWRSSSWRDSATMFLALLRNRPMVLMCSATPSSPRVIIASGVGAAANSLRVARFTLLSVACAESTTATSSW